MEEALYEVGLGKKKQNFNRQTQRKRYRLRQGIEQYIWRMDDLKSVKGLVGGFGQIAQDFGCYAQVLTPLCRQWKENNNDL